MSPHFIARDVLPRDHPIWQRRTKCGPNGTSIGGGANLFMGGYLGKVNRSGLIEVFYLRHDDRKLRLTKEGRKMLDDNVHLLEENDHVSSEER